MGSALRLVFLVVDFLWKLAGILFLVSIVLAAAGILEWSSPAEWLVVTLILAAIRWWRIAAQEKGFPMVSRLLSWGWSRRPAVDTESYAVLLNDALSRAASYRASDVVAREVGLDDDSEPTMEQGQALLNELMEEFSSFQDSVGRLEKIKPATSELLDLHMRAVGFLRGIIEIKGRGTALMVALAQGKHQTVAKLQKEGDHWLRVLPDVHGGFVKELQQVRVKQPQLFAEIGIPEWVLDELNLR